MSHTHSTCIYTFMQLKTRSSYEYFLYGSSMMITIALAAKNYPLLQVYVALHMLFRLGIFRFMTQVYRTFWDGQKHQGSRIKLFRTCSLSQQLPATAELDQGPSSRTAGPAFTARTRTRKISDIFLACAFSRKKMA